MCNSIVDERCIDGFCHAYLFGKGCKKGDACKWIHPTATQMFKKFKKNGGIDVKMMRCYQTPFCMRLMCQGKCNRGDDCCSGHSISAPSLFYWLKKKDCLVFVS
jgi:hypothetical protein